MGRRGARGRVITAEQVGIATATLLVALLAATIAPHLDEGGLIVGLTGAAAMVGLGAVLLGRAHPAFQAHGRGYTWTYWIAPAVWCLASALWLRVGVLGGGIGLTLGAALVLGGLLAAQQRELTESLGGRHAAGFLVSLVVFVSAFILFGLLYDARGGGPLGPLAVGLLATVLALVPLRRAVADELHTLIWAGVVGLVVGQVAWALHYWTAAAIVGGALLLLVFYLVVGVGEAVLDRSFGRRIALEYGLVGLIGLALVIGVGPGPA